MRGCRRPRSGAATSAPRPRAARLSSRRCRGRSWPRHRTTHAGARGGTAVEARSAAALAEPVFVAVRVLELGPPGAPRLHLRLDAELDALALELGIGGLQVVAVEDHVAERPDRGLLAGWREQDEDRVIPG